MKSIAKFLTFLTVFAMAASALCAVAVADPPKKTVPPRGPATVKELMTLLVEPASNGIFNIGGQPPKNEAEWKTLQGQALTLVEVASSLSSASRAKDKGEWLKLAKALQDSSKTAFAAAMAKNVDVLTDLSDPLYETCANCHEKYLPKQ